MEAENTGIEEKKLTGGALSPERRRLGLSLKLAIWLTGFILLVMLLFSTIFYSSTKNMLYGFYCENAQKALQLATAKISGDEVRRYIQQGYIDKSFVDRDAYFRSLKKTFNLLFFYIVIPYEDHVMYIYDAFNEGDNSETFSEFGDTDAYAASVEPGNNGAMRRTMAAGKMLPTFDIGKNDRYGTIASVYAPILDKNGESVALFCADYQLQTLEDAIKGLVRKSIGITMGLLVVLVLIYMYVMNRFTLQPLRRLTAYASSFVAQRREGEAGQNDLPILESIQGSRNDEIGDLAHSFLEMNKDMEQYETDLKMVSAAKQAIETELNVASRIQMMMLPRVFPPFTPADHFAIFATIEPAKSVGGDYYDFYKLDEDHVAVTIADVSGKGMPAALFMVIAKTIMKDRLQVMCGEPLGAIVKTINEELIATNEEMMFVTAFIGVLEVSTGTFRYVNCGHNPLFRYTPGQGFARFPQAKNCFLGVMDGMDFTEQTMEIAPGGYLYMYTDGVTEAMNVNHALYAEDRLEACLNRLDMQDSLENMLALVRADIAAHVADAPQSDDITMLMLRRDVNAES